MLLYDSCPRLSTRFAHPDPQGLRQLLESFSRPGCCLLDCDHGSCLSQAGIVRERRTSGSLPSSVSGELFGFLHHIPLRNLRNPPGPRASLEEWWFGNRKVPFRDPRWGCRLGDGVRARSGFAGKNVPWGCPFPTLSPPAVLGGPGLSLWAQGPLRGYKFWVRPS